MVFSSTVFLFIFLPAVTAAYYVIGHALTRRMTVKNGILLAASLVFYAWGEPVYIVLMVISILFNYFIGRDIDLARQAGNARRAKTAFIFAIVFNLALLGFFKYFGFLTENLNAWFHLNLRRFPLPLPIGISFYTFQILSYVIDLYHDRIRVQKNLLSFALYVTLFPQLIAGPIVKYRDVEQQLAHRKETLYRYSRGLTRFTVGLAKKLLLANTLGAVYSAVQAQGAAATGLLGAWTGIVCYTLQIYFDFSGYSDMAIGLGGMFGFRFNENFNYPYMAQNVTDFWRRWHISLSTWFKEYVYIPLGGNRCSKLMNVRNLMVVWLLTGLWHGAAWNFILWGVYYGVLLTAEKYLLGNALKKLPRPAAHALTLLAVAVGWVLFSAPTLSEAVSYLGSMCGFHGLLDASARYLFTTNLPVMLCGALAATTLWKKPLARLSPRVVSRAKIVALPLLLILCVIFMISETYNPFLYFRF